jgi:hypothetical protein
MVTDLVAVDDASDSKGLKRVAAVVSPGLNKKKTSI